MTRYYYSRQYFFAWCMGHYFYNDMHFSWVGAPFYPYKTANPDSSNPLSLYEQTYKPWKDADPNSDQWPTIRSKMRRGLLVQKNTLPAIRGIRSTALYNRLVTICDTIHFDLFYPIIYRVDVDRVKPANRLETAGSGLSGSVEYRIPDLRSAEFDILFMDLTMEPSLATDADFHNLAGGKLTPINALTILEKRCVP